MPRVSAAFFVTGGLFVLIGMLWGMYMGANQNFQLAPAHAHLNLLGWVTMALYGGFYALTARTMSHRLAWTNYVLSTLGVLVMIPAVAMVLSTGDKSLEKVVAVGGGLTLLSLLVFLASAFRELFRKRNATQIETIAADPMRIAAE